MTQGEAEEEVEVKKKRSRRRWRSRWETYASARWGSRYRVEAKRTRHGGRGMEEGVPRGRLKVTAGPHTRLSYAHTHVHTRAATQSGTEAWKRTRALQRRL